MKLVFASNNKHKLEEIAYIADSYFQIVSLSAIGCSDEIPETQPTIEGNALQKARYIYDKYHCNCFADDTGLEIDALNGDPGVYSARFAGIGCTFDDNMDKTLTLLKGQTNRKAKFRTVIALIVDGNEYSFHGYVNGTMLEEKQGEKGFGYDAIFMPEGYNESFAQMSSNTKNDLSHRSMAARNMISFIKSNPQLFTESIV
jgi:XTP/dITP diphosphohydrolase